SPFTALSFTLIGLYAVLAGGFRRHGGLARPLAAVGIVTLLLAGGLAIADVAARHPVLMPLIWLHATLPGAIAGWLLLGPGIGRRRAVRLRRLQAP
ncbi:MAG: LPS export ABC transporter permease LptF, partial [Acetobacteraceae bacterium]